jgi:hypothetical protein
LYRQGSHGIIQQIEELATRYRLKIRVLTPLNDSIKQLAQKMGKYADIRYIPEELQTKITIAIIDRKSSLVVELKAKIWVQLELEVEVVSVFLPIEETVELP